MQHLCQSYYDWSCLYFCKCYQSQTCTWKDEKLNRTLYRLLMLARTSPAHRWIRWALSTEISIRSFCQKLMFSFITEITFVYSCRVGSLTLTEMSWDESRLNHLEMHYYTTMFFHQVWVLQYLSMILSIHTDISPFLSGAVQPLM